MERDLHVKISHSAKDCNGTWQSSPPFGPGVAMVEAEENDSNVGTPATQGLLQGIPTSRILQGNIGTSRGESTGRQDIVETDSEVERGFPAGNVTAVDDSGNLVGNSFLGEGVRLGVNLCWIGESWKGGDNSREGGVIT